MRILLDNCTPRPLKRFLAEHQADTAREQGWERLRNGILLQAAENDGYEVMITTDQSLPFQQNMTGRRIAIVVVNENKWPILQNHIELITAALEDIRPGDIRVVQI